MISKFKLFELNSDTYKSAAEKARYIGHNKKAKRFEDWSELNTPSTRVTPYTPFELGKFKLSINKYKYERFGEIYTTYISEQAANKSRFKHELLEEGPYDAYISDIYVDEYLFEEDVKSEDGNHKNNL